MCFLLPLKYLEKHIWVQENFLFWVLGLLCFLKPSIGLIRFLECLLGVLGKLWVEKGFLNKKKTLIFSVIL